MPSPNDLRNKEIIELYSCPEFTLTGVLFPGKHLHLHVDWPDRKFTLSIYKKGLYAISVAFDKAKELGCQALYVLVPAHLVKWEQMFGFVPSEEWTNRFSDENLVLMKQAVV